MLTASKTIKPIIVFLIINQISEQRGKEIYGCTIKNIFTPYIGGLTDIEFKNEFFNAK